MKKEIKIFLTVFTMLLFTFSCEEKESGDVTAPGKLTINSITPTNGGGIISYTLPDDNDILFVRADIQILLESMFLEYLAFTIMKLKFQV